MSTHVTAQAREVQTTMASVPRALRLLLAAGVVGPALFVIALLVEGATRPGYTWWHQFGSELELSSQGWEMVANFLMCGLLCIAFAVGLRWALRPGKGAIVGPAALVIFGTALVVAGIFKTDPGLGYPPGAPALPTPTSHGVVHALAGLFAFVSLGIACFALARRFAGDARWRGWAAYSILTGIVVVLSLVVSNVPAMREFAGLIQRIGIIAGWTWIVLLAVQLLRDTRTGGMEQLS